MRAIFRAVAGLQSVAYALLWRASLRALWGAWRALLGLSCHRAASIAQFAGLSGFLSWGLTLTGAG